MSEFWIVLFNVLIHLLLLGTLVGFAIVLFLEALAPDNVGERIYRFLALLVGALLALLVQVPSLSIAVDAAHELARPKSVSSADVVSTVVPALAGVGLALLFVTVVKKKGQRTTRLLCLLGMFALISFLEEYALAVSASGFVLGYDALPNGAFVIGVGLTVLLTAGVEDESQTELSDWAKRTILPAWQRLAKRIAARKQAASDGSST